MDEGRRAGGDSTELEMQAAQWLLELEDPEISVERLTAWQRWLAEDPLHKAKFDQLRSTQEYIDAAPALLWPTDEEVATDTYDGSIAVTEWQQRAALPNSLAGRTARDDPRRATVPGHRRRRWLISGIAAGLGVLACGIWGYQVFEARQRVDTRVGELRRLQLSDGSSMTLGGQTRVSVLYDASARRIELDGGEAFFQVAKDAARPFVVRSGDAIVKAVGTAFNVKRANERLTVSVAEGVVEVSRAEEVRAAAPHLAATRHPVDRLVAGQQIRLDPQRPPLLLDVAPEAVAAWRDGKREYLAEPLADVVADLGRYSNRRIVIDEQSVGELEITGSLFEWDIVRWLRSLRSALPVQVSVEPDGVIHIRAREPAVR